MREALTLVLPGLLAAGLVLILLGLTPRSAAATPRRPPRRLAEWMVQAGLRDASPALLLALCAGVGLVAGVAVLAVSASPWIAGAFALLAGWLPLLVLRSRRSRRLRELQGVWPDAIDHLASGVRAGLSLPEALAALAERGPEPLREPVAGFAGRYHATGRFEAALDQLKDELADPTADRVIECLRMAREVGGTELGRTLRTLSGFLRDEFRVRREIEARQTWVVVAARLAFATPWVVLLLLSMRQEAAAAYRGSGGALVIAAGAAMAVAGYRLMLAVGRLPEQARVLR
ncbi:MAG TPA: type II secretion system F family protein [Actinomycetes bacterium]|nr:type II secretion system F family protein [Actinomycetes bacterium]